MKRTLDFSFISDASLKNFVHDIVHNHIGQHELKRNDLIKVADTHFNNAFSEGKYSLPYLYELVQFAHNMGIMQSSIETFAYPINTPYIGAYGVHYQELEKQALLLPTHTVRDYDKIDLQQFSTPPHYAYVAAVAAQIEGHDHVLEPSAGTAGLACFAAGWNENVWVNEIDTERIQLLRTTGQAFSRISDLDAGKLEFFYNDVPRPTVVLMNPPFSVDQGTKDPFTAARHIEQGLQKLDIGGRLVAIVSGGIDWGQEEAEANGMAMNAKRFAPWWETIMQQYTIRCNVGVNGKVYRKFGTDFRTRLVVIDKVGPQGETPVLVHLEGNEFVDSPLVLLNSPSFLAHVLRTRCTSLTPTQAKNIGKLMAAGAPQRKETSRALYMEPQAVTDTLAMPVDVAGESRKLRYVLQYQGEDLLWAERRNGDELAVFCYDTMFKPSHQYVAVNFNARWDAEFASCPELRTLVVALRKKTREYEMKGISLQDVMRARELGKMLLPVPAEGELDAETCAELDKPQVQPVVERVEAPEAQITPAEVVVVDVVAEESEANTEDTMETFHGYRPFVTVPGAKAHNVTLVESNTMRMARLPIATARVNLPQEAVERGNISAAQLENIVYAVHAHHQLLKDGKTRKAYMIGDGTGVGKGCQAAAIAMHYFLEMAGKVKVLWVSKEFSLIKDAKRDWTWIGGDEKFVVGQDKLQEQEIPMDRGIIFSTYSTMCRRGAPEVPGVLCEKTGKVVGHRAAQVDRQKQLIDWKPDVILWDESHLMGNAIAVKGARGTKAPSQRALGGMALQEALPDARITYLSATAATEVHNLGYAAERLGLCGTNVSGFPDLHSFVSQIDAAGMLGMELVAKDMKSMGLYNARSLSYEGTEFEMVHHTLTEAQVELYNEACYFWRLCYDWAKEGFQVTGTSNQARAMAMGQFWGAAQRFYNQILIAMQTPTAIEDMLKHLRNGEAIVVQLVSTNEAATNRAVSEALSNEQSLDDLDLTPKDALLNFIKNCFPVIQYQTVSKGDYTVQVMMTDGEGNPVLSPSAVKMQQELLMRVADMKVPKGALDQVLERMDAEGFPFAEISGRSARYLKLKDPETGEFHVRHESRNKKKGDVEGAEFMADQKRGLIFSGAGNTGRSFHSDLRCQNQRRRIHYVLQAGWRADEAIQGLGRTHRTNQANAPLYKLVTTNLPGQKRFITSIARRIEQLGSLTKGNRKAASNSMFSEADNLETSWAFKAIADIFKGLFRSNAELKDKIGAGFHELCDMMGFDMTDEDGNLVNEKLPSVTQFLNRVLFLPTHMQFRVFSTFEVMHSDIVETAKAKGLLDLGLEKITADRIVKVSDQLVYSDPDTGARTNVVELECFDKARILSFDECQRGTYLTRSQTGYSQQSGDFVSWVQNTASGRVYGLFKSTHDTTDEGAVVPMFRQTSPSGSMRETVSTFSGKNWLRLEPAQAAEAWAAEVAAMPKFHKDRVTLVTGAILPVWAQLSVGSGRSEVRVVVAETEKGERLVGRVIPSALVGKILSNLGATTTGVYYTSRELLQGVMEGSALEFSNGWKMVRRKIYADTYRVIVTGPGRGEAQAANLKSEFHGSNTFHIFHLPKTWDERVAAFDEFVTHRPVVRISNTNGSQDVLNKATEQSLEIAQQLQEIESYSFAELINWHSVPLTPQELLLTKAEELLEEAETEATAPVEMAAVPVKAITPKVGTLTAPKPRPVAPPKEKAPLPEITEGMSHAQRVALLYKMAPRNSKVQQMELAGQTSLF